MTANVSEKRHIEWPTWLLIGFVYSSWAMLIVNAQALADAVFMVLMTLTLTLHSSLSHEIIHGHPTGQSKIDDWIGFPPIGIIYPYRVFKITHLAHHNNQLIALPGIDPECFFVGRDAWQRYGAVRRALAWFNMTLFGRLLLGPGHSILSLVKQSLYAVRRRDARQIRMWLAHYFWVVFIFWALSALFHISPWVYFACAWFALSLIMFRSFFEHRPERLPEKRSVIQEGDFITRFLFLNNNYHYVHHTHPSLPWYKVRSEYLNNRERYVKENGHFLYRGYASWLSCLFRPVQSPVHPYAHTGDQL